ncbi:uncharacterized protein LOC121734476 [Aricia agestis]|uniref:uncharacterized protein LOC121734476 n=1 Tax=Aricia agestis TaxID=91739 RepID=UPI001C206943|nr:uncharacterized protein LOC121734476 [Aricia agestis]
MDRIRNTTLRSKTRLMDVGRKAAGLKRNWAGHVTRMHPDRWARLVTEWQPNGRRNRGRPKKRWRDQLDAADKEWPNTAKNRDTSHAFAAHCTSLSGYRAPSALGSSPGVTAECRAEKLRWKQTPLTGPL